MAGYIGSKSSVTLVDGYTEAEADATFLTPTGDGSGLTGLPSGTPSIVDNGDATAITIDSNENVGIGTDSPDTKIQIKGAVNSSQLILGGTDSRGLKISTTNEGGQNDGSVIFDAQDTEGSGVNSNLIFKNGGSESMRITGSGDVLVGTGNGSNTVGPKLYGGNPSGNNNYWEVRPEADGSNAGKMYSRVNNDNPRTHITFGNPNGSVGTIITDGSSTGYNTSSDYRLKENVVDLTGASARVNQLNPSRFNFIADDTNTLVDGFLAHEVADVVPEAITGTKDAVDADGNPEYQGIDQSKLVPLLTAALQEALTEIASLKTRVEALEA